MEYIKKIIQQFADSIPEQTKANVDAKHNFDNDNNALLKAFAEIDIFGGNSYENLEINR